MKHRNPEQGTAMLLALILVMVLSIGATATWRHMHLVRAQADRFEKQEVARQLAEAGLNKAIAVLRVNSDYRGEADTPLGAGRFSVQVMGGEAPGAYALHATGQVVNDRLIAHSAELDARLRLASDGNILEFTWQPEADESGLLEAEGAGT